MTSKIQTTSWGQNAKHGDYLRDEATYTMLKMPRTPVVLTHAMAVAFNSTMMHDADSLRAAVKFLKPNYNFCPSNKPNCIGLQEYLHLHCHIEFLDANDPGNLKVFDDQDNFHKLWNIVSDWERERGYRGNNGWDRHGVRFLARLAWWSLNDKSPSCANWLPPPDAPDAAPVVVIEPPPPDPPPMQLVLPASKFSPTPPTRAEQLEAACGFNVDLVAYARKQYGATPGGIPTSAIRRWYERHPTELPARFSGRKFGMSGDSLQICHIISKANGGVDWPHNFVIADARTNRFFSDDIGRAWREYVGKTVWQHAQTLARWHAKKSSVLFRSFDPIEDFRLAR